MAESTEAFGGRGREETAASSWGIRASVIDVEGLGVRAKLGVTATVQGNGGGRSGNGDGGGGSVRWCERGVQGRG